MSARNVLADLSAFFMDVQIMKYRFGKTLELAPSVYEFGTDTTIPIWIKSVCKYAPLYFLAEGVTLVPYSKNQYICKDILNANIIRNILQAYWDEVNNQCVEF
jgi:hypothetical protein